MVSSICELVLIYGAGKKLMDRISQIRYTESDVFQCRLPNFFYFLLLILLIFYHIFRLVLKILKNCNILWSLSVKLPDTQI